MKSQLIRLAVFFGAVALVVVGLPYALPAVLGKLAPDIVFRGPAEEKVLYLTIDDAPSPATRDILAVLSRHGVHATFFITGSRVRSDAQLSGMVASGSELGNHLWSTTACSSLPLGQFTTDLERTDELLKRYRARFFRPTSGFGSEQQRRVAAAHGYTSVLGTIYPFEASIHTPSVLSLLVQWLSVPGGIIILHDGSERGLITAQTLDLAIPALQAKGYEFRLLQTPQ